MADFSKAKGNKTLQSVASKSALMKAGAVVKQLPVKELKDNPDNEYLFGMEQSDIEHTTTGIRKNGFKGAINVYSCPDGTYEVYSGHIRKYAAIEAGLDTISCLIEPEPEETVKRRQLLGANLYGRNKVQSDNPILVARQIHYHRETLEMEGFKGDTREQIAVDFRISDSQVYKYEALLKLEPELQEVVAERKAPWSILYTAKSFSKEEQKQLAAIIREASETAKEPVTKRELKDFMNSILNKKPVTGQMNIEDYTNVEMKTAYDRLPEQVEGNCNGNCFYCRNENCNGSQIKREHCIFDSDTVCKMYEKHEIAVKLGMNCDSSCCRDCDKECSVRCDNWKVVQKSYNSVNSVHGEHPTEEQEECEDCMFNNNPEEGIWECHPENGEHKCYEEEIEDEADPENLPPADRVYKVYEDIGGGIRNYYELRDYLINNEASEEPSGAVKSELEKRIYKLEEELSTAGSIQWSNADEAKKIVKSLIAMLEDEIDAI